MYETEVEPLRLHLSNGDCVTGVYDPYEPWSTISGWPGIDSDEEFVPLTDALIYKPDGSVTHHPELYVARSDIGPGGRVR